MYIDIIYNTFTYIMYIYNSVTVERDWQFVNMSIKIGVEKL